MKRGQATLFIILGVIIIAMVVFVTLRYISKPDVSQIINQGENQTITKIISEECLEEVGREALFLLGEKGRIHDEEVYYAIDGIAMIPDFTRIEADILEYINDNLERCGGGNARGIFGDKVIFSVDGVGVEFDVRLETIYEVASEIVNENKDGLCVNCLNELEDGMYVTVYNIDEEDKVIEVKDIYSELAGLPYEFRFGMKI